MKKKIFPLLSVLTLSGLFTACNNDTSSSSLSSNETVTTNLSVTGSGQNAVAMSTFQKGFSLIVPSAIALTPPPLEDSTGTSVQLNEAWIVLKKIQFKWTSDNENTTYSDDSANYKGPFFIDLLSDTPVQLGKISVPEKGVTGLKMLLHKDNNLPQNVPSPLRGNSIYLAGSVNGHQFTYVADDTTDFSITGSNAVVPENGKDFVVALRLADLFKKIDLSSITTDVTISSSSRFSASNPCPEIHPTAGDLYACFKMGLNKEAKLGKDDGDHDLDSNDESVN